MKRTHFVLLLIAGIVCLLILVFFLFRTQITSYFFRPTQDTVAEEVNVENADIELVAEGLQVPWSLVLLPDGDMVVSERFGRVQRIGTNPFEQTIADVVEQGEGGLLGLALHPEFADNQWLYLYKTTASDNRVERYTVGAEGLTFDRVIFDGIPRSGNHNGGRIAFGPDGMLYIATGDAGDQDLAQQTDSLAGKILRITQDGDTPQDNPFNSDVYSYGHRNIQGLAWDSDGQLWATEHGRSGSATGFDELNRIEPGGNYGWPVIQGDETWADMQAPILHSGPTTTWAPGSLAFSGDTFYFGGLRGQSIYAVSQRGDKLGGLRSYFAQQFGRIRDVIVDDEWLYFTTSNRDGRGSPQEGDDKIIRIPLSQVAM